ncbi:PHYTOL KINASE 1 CHLOROPLASTIC, partial [Salix koriyanagi]
MTILANHDFSLKLIPRTTKADVVDDVLLLPLSPLPLSLFDLTFITDLDGERTRRRSKVDPTARAAVAMLHQDPVVSDLIAAGLSGTIALSILRLFEETAKRRVFDQKLNRKLVHISIGLVFMLCWPMFSSGHRGALLAAFIPGLNIIKMLLIGSGMWKDEATVKSMSRFGDR